MQGVWGGTPAARGANNKQYCFSLFQYCLSMADPGYAFSPLRRCLLVYRSVFCSRYTCSFADWLKLMCFLKSVSDISLDYP